MPVISVVCLGLQGCFLDNREPHLKNDVGFEMTDWIIHTRETRCVDFDASGNAWIGSGTELFRYSTSGGTYGFDAGSEIRDLSVGIGSTIWLGTADSGLARFDGEGFEWYTVENSGFPRNYIAEVEAAGDGTVWFTSCAHQSGGLMKYEDGSFTLYTPENSLLNHNLVMNLELDVQGNLYFTTEATASEPCVYRISSSGMEIIGEEDGRFYWVTGLCLTSTDRVYLLEDFSLSSLMQENKLHVYESGMWSVLAADFKPESLRPIATDNRDYLWTVTYVGSDSPVLHVYNGTDWQESAKGALPDNHIRSIRADPQNRIWLCTDKGVLVIAQ